jgi:hypothetical protein
MQYCGGHIGLLVYAGQSLHHIYVYTHALSLSLSLSLSRTHTHTHTHMYKYICAYVYIHISYASVCCIGMLTYAHTSPTRHLSLLCPSTYQLHTLIRSLSLLLQMLSVSTVSVYVSAAYAHTLSVFKAALSELKCLSAACQCNRLVYEALRATSV